MKFNTEQLKLFLSVWEEMKRIENGCDIEVFSSEHLQLGRHTSLEYTHADILKGVIVILPRLATYRFTADEINTALRQLGV